MKVVFDSDVLIDFLQGLDKAKREWERYPKKEISIVSWLEILAGADTPEEEKICQEFLSGFTIHQLSLEIAAEAVRLRRASRIRLPDAIIWATARVHGCLLVTRNTKDFPSKEPGIRIPYSIS